MILENLAKAIRTQNYYAVFLEFLIVIAGVVIGFQITAWNADREDREKEISLLVRLHDEVQELMDQRATDTRTMEQRLGLIMEAYVVVLGEAAFRPLTDAECHALVLAHDFYYPQVTLPAINESLATGQFDLLTNVTLRTELSRYIQISEQALAIHGMMIAGSDRLGARHQAFFTNELKFVTAELAQQMARVSRYDTTVAGDRMVTVCDVEGMMTDKYFIGDLADLIGKSMAYDINANEAPDRQLRIVLALLEAELDAKGVTP